MFAVGLAFALFACWSVVGYALTSSLLSARKAISNLLLAPVVGMGALELAAHIGLRCESPVGPIARPIVLAAMLIAGGILLLRRPPFPFHRALPFGLIITAAFILSGWPLFRWGGDWIANANGDVVNYCIGATGFRDHGFRSLQIDKFFAGEDLTYRGWPLYADRVGHRHGSEMSLAMTSAIASLPTPFVFMPVILAMHMVLISAVGYLMYRTEDDRIVAWIACGLMALSPLSTYGVVQQLLGQVGGLAILVASVGFFLQPARGLPSCVLAKRGVLGGIIAATLMLHYTESLPLLVACFGLHFVMGVARGRPDIKQLTVAFLSAVLAIPLLGTFLVPNISFLMCQASLGKEYNPTLAVIFPQYMNVEGLARLWGFATVYEPYILNPQSDWPCHRLVLEGGFFLLLSAAAGIALTWRRRPVGTMLLVMIGVAVVLMRARSAFGLFKLAMYAQPFLLGSLVLGWAMMRPGYLKWTGLLCLLVLVPLQLSTQFKYVSCSSTETTAGGEVPGATRERLFAQYWEALQTPGAKRFVVPVNDWQSIKFMANFSHGVTVCIPSDIPVLPVFPSELEEPYRAPLEHLLVLRSRPAREGKILVAPSKNMVSIPLHDRAKPDAVANFELFTPSWIDRPQPGDYLLEPPERFELFNRARRGPTDRMCRVVPLSEARNYIFWHPSSLSNRLNDSAGVTPVLYALQPDQFFPQDNMAASGRYLTFRVLNPSPKVRMLFAGTASYIAGEFNLPPAAAIGDGRVPLPLIGNGAARVVSEPFSVQTRETGNFLILDLGRIPAPPQEAGNPATRDPRQISMYVRDVSLLAEEEYAAWVPPECVRTFPVDLGQKNLEFSGCLEEGSVSSKCWFRLSQPQAHLPLQIRGRLRVNSSKIVDPQTLIVKWNGVEVGRTSITSSEFALNYPLTPGAGPGKVELEFANANSSPQSTLKLCAQLTFVGFEH